MLGELRLDHAGIAEILKSGPMQAAVTAQAQAIAGQVQTSIDPDAEVVVDEYTTDRAAASVTIKDARGLIWQARDGVLTRSAASTGLEVTETA